MVFLILTLCSGCLTKNAEVNMFGWSDFNTYMLMWNSDKYSAAKKLNLSISLLHSHDHASLSCSINPQIHMKYVLVKHSSYLNNEQLKSKYLL